ELDRMVDQVRVEVFDLFLRQVNFLETRDDLVVGQESLLLAVLDELLKLLHLRKCDVDSEHWPSPVPMCCDDPGHATRSLPTPQPSSCEARHITQDLQDSPNFFVAICGKLPPRPLSHRGYYAQE